MINLTKRLKALAELASEGKNIADIGTDHGYIPVYFAQMGTAQRIVASDVAVGPINSAKNSAENYGVKDKIEFVVADGLAGIDDSFDTVIIAGMGGDTIVSILEASTWAMKKANLILQPQSKITKLVRFLNDNGCRIEKAKLVEDSGKTYVVFSARYTGEKATLTEAQCLAVKPLFDSRDVLLHKYLLDLEKKLTASIKGMMESNSNIDDKLKSSENTLNEIKNMINEVEKW
jgi:tRNA (adenine22-N1)-methyltransferase